MGKEYFILVTVFMIYSCKSEQSKIYDEKVALWRQYKNEYIYGAPNNEQTHNEFVVIATPFSKAEIQAYRNTYRDSLYMVINEIDQMDLTPQQRSDTYLRKAEIYYEEGENLKAIEALKHVDRSLPFSRMQDILINKLKVKEARKDADSLALTNLYKIILGDYQNYYNEVEVTFKKTFQQKDSDKISHSWANTILVEIFHCKIQLEGKARTIEQIDSLQIAIEGNKVYFDQLRELFNEENYHVLFE